MICNKEYNKMKCGGKLKRMRNDFTLGRFNPIPLYFCNKCGEKIAICESGNYVESITLDGNKITINESKRV